MQFNIATHYTLHRHQTVSIRPSKGQQKARHNSCHNIIQLSVNSKQHNTRQ